MDEDRVFQVWKYNRTALTRTKRVLSWRHVVWGIITWLRSKRKDVITQYITTHTSIAKLDRKSNTSNMHMCASGCESWGLTSNIFFNFFPPYLLKHSLPWNWKLTNLVRLAGQWAPGIHLIPLLCTGVIDTACHTQFSTRCCVFKLSSSRSDSLHDEFSANMKCAWGRILGLERLWLLFWVIVPWDYEVLKLISLEIFHYI